MYGYLYKIKASQLYDFYIVLVVPPEDNAPSIL